MSPEFVHIVWAESHDELDAVVRAQSDAGVIVTEVHDHVPTRGRKWIAGSALHEVAALADDEVAVRLAARRKTAAERVDPNLTRLRDLLEHLAAEDEIVAVFDLGRDTDSMLVGRIQDLGDERFTLDLVDTDATWGDELQAYRFDEVSSVEWGTDYLRALDELLPGELPDLTIDWWNGDRAAIRHSFELAEDSVVQLDAYLELGRVLVATDEHGTVVGHLQLIPVDDPAAAEVKNMAVDPDHQGEGIGRALLERAIAESRSDGRATLLVSTGAVDVGNLRFYQRLGFRMVGIGIDAFTPETGYPEPIVVDGMELRDRVDFAMRL